VEREVLLADTVGFIRDLPRASWRPSGRLEEIETSSSSFTWWTLPSPTTRADGRRRRDPEGLELGDIPRLVVYNKADLLSEARTELGSATTTSWCRRDR
jgi:50S ribosomal subunit-associated GTPase HflX